MTDNDVAILLGYAAAAIALAGFSSLVTSIDRRQIGVGSDVISLRIRSLITISFMLVFLSLFPPVLEGLGVEIDLLWIISCAASLVFFLPMLIQQASQQLQRSKLNEQGFSWSLYWLVVSLALIGSSSAVAGLLDILAPRGAFFAALLSCLAIIFSFFYRIVLMVDDGARIKDHSD